MNSATESKQKTPHQPKWWFGPVALLLSTVLSISILEGLAWTYFNFRMKPSLGKRWVELAVNGRITVPPPREAAHPYLLYVNQPGHSNQINRFGLRGPEVATEKTPGVLRILFLGGSTVFSYSVNDYRDAWVWQLGEMLQRQIGTKVEVLNAGLPYGTTAENLAAYVFRYRYLNPDVVVIEAGGNDQIVTWYPNYEPEYTHFRGQGVWWEPSKGERFVLRSNIARVTYAGWLDRRLGVCSVHPYGYERLDRQEVLQRVRACSLEGFRRNLDLMVKLAKSDDASVLLVSFLQAKTERLAKNRPELIGMEQICEEGLQRHTAVMREVAAAHKVPLVIPRLEQFTEEMFTDNCHLTVAGEKTKAEEVRPALEALLTKKSK